VSNRRFAYKQLCALSHFYIVLFILQFATRKKEKLLFFASKIHTKYFFTLIPFLMIRVRFFSFFFSYKLYSLYWELVAKTTGVELCHDNKYVTFTLSSNSLQDSRKKRSSFRDVKKCVITPLACRGIFHEKKNIFFVPTGKSVRVIKTS